MLVTVVLSFAVSFLKEEQEGIGRRSGAAPNGVVRRQRRCRDGGDGHGGGGLRDGFGDDLGAVRLGDGLGGFRRRLGDGGCRRCGGRCRCGVCCARGGLGGVRGRCGLRVGVGGGGAAEQEGRG